MIERRIACFPQKNEALPRLSAALASGTALEPYADVSALIDAIRADRIDATVVFVDDKSFDAAESAIKRIRVGFASHPLVAYFHPRTLTPRHLLRVAQAGITELVQFDVDDSRHNLARILNAASRVSHAEALATRLRDVVPDDLRPLLVYALEHAGSDMDAPALAAAFGLSNRTLSWRMLQYNVPRPRKFLTWCRLLVAAAMLNDNARTLDSVSEQLNFPGGHTLGGVFFRYMNRGINSLREEGVLEEVLLAFRKELAAPRPTSLPTRIRRG
ncbi:MAG: hypothetical protein H7Z40_23970 [Phycisphaerae bacterium]|nr:hypothetical protein [Gemmatimonadaceae bacterium]